LSEPVERGTNLLEHFNSVVSPAERPERETYRLRGLNGMNIVPTQVTLGPIKGLFSGS